MQAMKAVMFRQAAVTMLMLTLGLFAAPLAFADQSGKISQPACKAAADAGQAAPPGCNGTTLESTGTTTGYLDVLMNALVFVGAATAVIFIIVGGIRFMTATGDPGRIKQAKDTVLYAVLGLVVLLLVRFIIAFVVGSVKV